MDVVVYIGLHPWGIPHRTCRFYCCLAAHQRTRKKDSAEPSFPILWTPPHPPGESAAAGHFGCRGEQGYRIPVSGADCSSPLRRIVLGNCVRAEAACISENHVGLWAFVFHWWWDGLYVPAATVDLAFSFVELPLTATLYQYCMVQAHFTNCAGQRNVGKMRSYSLYCKETGIPSSLNL